jgi:hypothetical protein
LKETGFVVKITALNRNGLLPADVCIRCLVAWKKDDILEALDLATKKD